MEVGVVSKNVVKRIGLRTLAEVDFSMNIMHNCTFASSNKTKQ